MSVVALTCAGVHMVGIPLYSQTLVFLVLGASAVPGMYGILRDGSFFFCLMMS